MFGAKPDSCLLTDKLTDSRPTGFLWSSSSQLPYSVGKVTLWNNDTKSSEININSSMKPTCFNRKSFKVGSMTGGFYYRGLIYLFGNMTLFLCRILGVKLWLLQ